MQIKGKIPQKMVRKGVLGETYFDEEFKFMSEEVDPLSKQAALLLRIPTRLPD